VACSEVEEGLCRDFNILHSLALGISLSVWHRLSIKQVGIDAERQKKYDELQKSLLRQEAALRKLDADIVIAKGAAERRKELMQRRREDYTQAFSQHYRGGGSPKNLYRPLRETLKDKYDRLDDPGHDHRDIVRAVNIHWECHSDGVPERSLHVTNGCGRAAGVGLPLLDHVCRQCQSANVFASFTTDDTRYYQFPRVR
jgi:hypothetical protein